jgi:hypothetical protein
MNELEEAFLITRELSKSRGNLFRWYQLRNAIDCVSTFSWNTPVYKKLFFLQKTDAFIKKLVKIGMIEKVHAGLYNFTYLASVSSIPRHDFLFKLTNGS